MDFLEGLGFLPQSKQIFWLVGRLVRNSELVFFHSCLLPGAHLEASE